MVPWLAFPVIVLLLGLALVRWQQHAGVSRRREIVNLLMVAIAFLMAVGLILRPLDYPIAFTACWLAVSMATGVMLLLAGWDAVLTMRTGSVRRQQLRQELRSQLMATAARKAKEESSHG